MSGADSRIVWSPEAESDLLNIWTWGARLFTPDQADAHLRDIRRSVMRLLEYPHLGRARDELLVGIRSLVVHPSCVFYQIVDQRIEIVRVVDGRRNLAVIFSSAGDL